MGRPCPLPHLQRSRHLVLGAARHGDVRDGRHVEPQRLRSFPIISLDQIR